MELHVLAFRQGYRRLCSSSSSNFVVCGSQFSDAIHLLRNMKYKIFESCLKLEWMLSILHTCGILETLGASARARYYECRLKAMPFVCKLCIIFNICFWQDSVGNPNLLKFQFINRAAASLILKCKLQTRNTWNWTCFHDLQKQTLLL